MKYGLITLAGFMVAAGITAFAQKASVHSPAVTDSSVTSAPGSAAVPGFQERHPRYRLRKGDSFELDFAMTPDFNQTIAVQPDGYITLKAVGSVFVEGQIVPELTETLKTA